MRRCRSPPTRFRADARPTPLESPAALGSAAAAARADQQAAEQRQLAGQALETGAQRGPAPEARSASLDLVHGAGRTIGRGGPRSLGRTEHRHPTGIRAPVRQQRGARPVRAAPGRSQAAADRRRPIGARDRPERARRGRERRAGPRARLAHAQSAVARIRADRHRGSGTLSRRRVHADRRPGDRGAANRRPTRAGGGRTGSRRTLIARLRFESGTLIRVDRQLQPHFLPGDLVSIPRGHSRAGDAAVGARTRWGAVCSVALLMPAARRCGRPGPGAAGAAAPRRRRAERAGEAPVRAAAHVHGALDRRGPAPDARARSRVAAGAGRRSRRRKRARRRPAASSTPSSRIGPGGSYIREPLQPFLRRLEIDRRNQLSAVAQVFDALEAGVRAQLASSTPRPPFCPEPLRG